MFHLFETDLGPTDTLRFVEEKGRVGLWSYDLTSRKLECSRGTFALVGLEPGAVEPTLALLASYVHPEDRVIFADIERRIPEGLPITCEVRLLRPQGGVCWLSAQGEVLFDEQGRPRKAVGIVFDTTRRHEALKALEVTEERQRALATAISEVVWTARSDGSAVDIPDWRRLTGQTLEEVREWGWIAALHPEDRERTRAAWQRAVESRTPYAAEFRVRCADGEYRWHRSRGAAVLNRDGSLREWVGVAIDIHDHKTGGVLYPLRSPANQHAITGAQLRAARGILNWSVRDLSEAARVSAATIRRLEESNGPPGNCEEASPALRDALERNGVEFLFPSIGKPAVRLR